MIMAHIGSRFRRSGICRLKVTLRRQSFLQRLDLGNKVVPEKLAQLPELIERQVI